MFLSRQRRTLPPNAFPILELTMPFSVVRRAWQAARALVCVAIVASCGGDSTLAPKRPLIPVQLAVAPAQVTPAGSVTITASATPDADDPLTVLSIAVSGIATLNDSLVVSSTGGATFSRVVVLPLDIGTLKVIGSVRSRSGNVGSTETSFSVSDSRVPTITASLSPAITTAAQPGDTLRVSLSASDDISLKYTVVRATGSFTATDSVAYTGRTTFVNRTPLLVIPRTATLGASVLVVAETMDVGGNVVRMTVGNVPVNDILQPSVSAILSGARSNGSFAPGSAAQVVVTATDNVTLKRLGAFVAALGVGDSVTVNATSGTFTLSIPLPSGRTGSFPITVFAVDGAGNRAQLLGGILNVDNRTRRAVVTAAVSGVRDLAFDEKRGVVYASVPASNNVQIFSATDATAAGVLSLPGQPYGIDVSLGGDTLFAALRNTTNLAATNLVTGAVTTIPLSTDQFFSQRPDNVRVAANNRVVYSLTFAGSGYGGSVKDLDLRTGNTMSVKTVTEATPLGVTGNRQRILGLVDDSCCPEEGFVYEASTGTFTLSKGTVSRFFPGVAADFTGSTFLIGSDVFSSTLAFMKTVHAPGASSNAVALSPDGLTAYLSTSTGVARIRISDDAVLETFATNAQPTSMRISSDGLTLAVATATRLYIVDLW